MSEQSTTNQASGKEGSGWFNSPAAIVIAGGLIALAIYFSGGQQTVGLGKQVASPVASVDANNEDARVGNEFVAAKPKEVDETDHIRGAKQAKVTIIEYSDTECPFCKQFHSTLTQLITEYPNDVRWVYRHFPLEQLHKKAPREALATECASEQGKFWEMVDLIYKETPSNDGLDLVQLPTYAQRAGVANIGQFNNCLSSNKYQAKVQAQEDDAVAAGGRGTPFSVIVAADGKFKPLSGALPYEAVKAAVEEYL